MSKRNSSHNTGLHRDDDLSVFRNISGRQAEKHKKIIQKVFKDKGSQTIIQCDLKLVDYLDKILNLNDGTYKPSHKPNQETTYIHVEKDHHDKLSRRFQGLLKKYYLAYVQQRK